jgi:protease-4
LLVAGCLTGFMYLLQLPAVAADDAKADEKEDKKVVVAHIKLSGEQSELPTAADPLLGFQPENFKAKLDRILKAKKDKNVKAVLLQIEGIGMGWGKLNEVRAVISEFRKTGRKVYAYMEDGSTMDYLVAASCDEVAMPPSGSLLLTGLAAEASFYKDLFEKLGLHADMIQMGDFKGAAEPFTRSSMSPEFRKQLESVLDDYYEYLTATIADSRKDFTAERVKKLLDEGPFTAKKAHELRLIDRLAYQEDFQKAIDESLKKAEQVEKVTLEKDYAKDKPKDLDNPFAALLKIMSASKDTTKLSKNPKVAVIYASGVIVTGKGGESLFGGNMVGSTTLVEAIRKAEEEATVKAIVLRVDSPGGSALASDLIWNELAKSKKPVIASMSDVAASGGYYISMAANKIYAEPGTLTGSIGVVGGKIVFGGLFDKVGVKTEIITRGKNANIMSITTPFSDTERKAMKDMMGDIYDQFLTKALQGREKAGTKMTRADLEKLAGGRIWTGRQAKQNGLVDELGTLEDAITAAKKMASIDKEENVELWILPKGKSFLDSLFDSLAETQAPPLPQQQIRLKELAALPELAVHLRMVEGLLHLRGEPVWAILPHRIQVK